MTIRELKKNYKDRIELSEFDILLGFILKKDRVFLYSHPEFKISRLKIQRLNDLITKRIRGVPIAYLIGHKEFYGLDFEVNEHTLVPRPETELMVEEALRITHNAQHITLIDIGTGSGCIIVSIAKQLEKLKIPPSVWEDKYQNLRFIGIDISSEALKIAKKNAIQNRIDKKIKFQKSDLLKNVDNSLFTIHNSILILANLPYLTPKQIKNSPTIKKEPRLALVAGSDGLKYYRRLFKQIKKFCDVRSALCVLCEIDPSQKYKMASLVKNELPSATYQIKKDLKGHARLVVIYFNR